MAKEVIMRMAAGEAYKLLNEAVDKITSAADYPEQVTREVINKRLKEACDLLHEVNNWLYAIKSV